MLKFIILFVGIEIWILIIWIWLLGQLLMIQTEMILLLNMNLIRNKIRIHLFLDWIFLSSKCASIIICLIFEIARFSHFLLLIHFALIYIRNISNSNYPFLSFLNSILLCSLNRYYMKLLKFKSVLKFIRIWTLIIYNIFKIVKNMKYFNYFQNDDYFKIVDEFKFWKK